MKDRTSAKFKFASPNASRPFRIWDGQRYELSRGRNYKHPRNALDGALLMARWANVGKRLEVFDAVSGALLGTYTRKEHTITFEGPQTTL